MLTRSLIVLAVALGIAGAMWVTAVVVHVARSDHRWRQLRRELEERPRRPLTWQ